MAKAWFSVVTSSVLLLCGWAPQSAVGQANNQAALFTDDQASRGRLVYVDQCAECHGRALDDGTAPPLAGNQFAESWSRPGTTLDDLVYIIRSTMPEGEGGTLSDEQYLDVVAFLLQSNGYAAGASALTFDPAVLTSVAIEPSRPAAAAPGSSTDFIRGTRGLDPQGVGPSQTDLNAAGENSRDWLYHTKDYSGGRYADLAEINADNVSGLAPACIYQMGEAGPFQSGPLVHDGVMYLTSMHATVALDAATCTQIWRHEWEERAFWISVNNRGVAIKDGRVVRATADGYLVALDAADGELLWARKVGDTMKGETFTMPPLIYEDLIVIGPAVSELAIEGWVAAFKLENGELVWHFNTVPGAKDGTGTWPNPTGIVLGGGAVWTPLSLDPDTEELFVAVTNPAPDLPADLRPGLNLYTNSIVALDVRSGELRWYEQLVPNDSHDWDLTQVSPLFRTTIAGEVRDVVATSGKDAFLRVLDRETHEVLYETAVSSISNVDVPLTREGVRVCPGIEGGVLWNGPSYNPRTDHLYVGAVEWCATFGLVDEVRFVPGQLYLGGTVVPDPTYEGRVVAIDASDGSVRWTYRSERPVVGAVTSTAGDLVFVGELTGDLIALHAESGEELYRFNTGGPIGGGVTTYTVGGKQYVAVASGDPSTLNWRLGHKGAPTLLIFALPS